MGAGPRAAAVKLPPRLGSAAAALPRPEWGAWGAWRTGADRGAGRWGADAGRGRYRRPGGGPEVEQWRCAREAVGASAARTKQALMWWRLLRWMGMGVGVWEGLPRVSCWAWALSNSAQLG